MRDVANATWRDRHGFDTVTANELSWSWLPSAARQASDPNRLVAEERSNPSGQGEDYWAYKKEYRYDPAGNRLAMRESTWNNGSRTWTAATITRYNYMYQVNSVRPNDPTVVPDDCDANSSGVQPCTGEPNSGALDAVGNDYGATGQGQDRLLSIKVYTVGESLSSPSHVHYRVYDYDNCGAQQRYFDFLSRITDVIKAPGSDWVKKTTRLWHNETQEPGPAGWLHRVHVEEWPQYPADCQYQENTKCPTYAYTEIYGYDYMGRRIGQEHCADVNLMVGTTQQDGQACKSQGITCDYDGSRMIAERHRHYGGGTSDGWLSTYAWGPLGLISRTVENGNTCLEDNCTYDYVADGVGNCTGVVDHSGSGQIQFTRMDAWGNPLVWHASPASQPVVTGNPSCGSSCASQPAMGDEVLAGPFQYHGNEGYQTQVVDPGRGQSAPPMGRSTGFMLCGARYYEAEVGRFLEYDQMPLAPSALAVGQVNRSTYCFGDPINRCDPRGHWGDDDQADVDVGAMLAGNVSAWLGGVYFTGGPNWASGAQLAMRQFFIAILKALLGIMAVGACSLGTLENGFLDWLLHATKLDLFNALLGAGLPYQLTMLAVEWLRELKWEYLKDLAKEAFLDWASGG